MADAGIGAMAQQMAHAPTGERKQERKQSNPLADILKLEGFKPPAKAQDSYPRDNGDVSTKLAYAIVAIGNSGIVFQCNVNKIAPKVGDPYIEVTLPSGGNGGFRRQTFIANTPKASAALDLWKIDVAKRYLSWRAGNREENAVTDSGRERVTFVE